MEPVFIAIIAFVFALFFYLSSLQERCWYRRGVFPAMFLIFGMLYYEEFFIFALFWIAAALTFFGFKGYGRKIKEIEEKEKEELNENSS